MQRVDPRTLARSFLRHGPFPFFWFFQFDLEWAKESANLAKESARQLEVAGSLNIRREYDDSVKGKY
jgi:hypothetical protein